MFQFQGFKHRLHLDFETYSECDIRKAGAHKYAADSSTEVLMLAYARDDGPVQQWLPHEGSIPPELTDLLMDASTAKVAFNATFERLIFRDVLKMDIPVEQWRCTMVCAYYLGFVGGLDAVLSQSPIPHTKDPRGGRLIQMLSKPNPKNYLERRYTWENRPTEFQEFCEYNIQDVQVERELLLWLAKYPMMEPWDWQRYAVDQKINDRGAHVDTTMARGAVEIWDAEKENLSRELRILTGLPKTTRAPFLRWLNDQGVPAVTVAKEDLQALASEGVPDKVARAIDLWIAKEAKATTKYNAVLNGAGDDGRVRGMFQFKGASRTDRTAGRRLQLQNLKRPFCKSEQEIKVCVDAIRTGNADLVRMVSPKSVSDTLGGCIRHVIQAKEGNTLVAQDLTSIESVMLGWVSNCDKILDTFRQGHDTYKVFASAYFGVPYDEVTKAQRTFSKPPVLGAGFMLGWKGLIAYAEGMGVALTEDEARRAIETFRAMYPEIVEFWGWIIKAVKYVILTGNPLDGYRLHLERDEDFLRIRLPSGRNLSYYQPEVQERVAPWSMVDTDLECGNDCPLQFARKKYPGWTDRQLEAGGILKAQDWIEAVTYMGTNVHTTKWERVSAHAGGFTENVVQSMAYDILMEGLVKAETVGLSPVIQVHDEIVCETGDWALEQLGEFMATVPAWGENLWLGADGYTGRYYTKD